MSTSKQRARVDRRYQVPTMPNETLCHPAAARPERCGKRGCWKGILNDLAGGFHLIPILDIRVITDGDRENRPSGQPDLRAAEDRTEAAACRVRHAAPWLCYRTLALSADGFWPTLRPSTYGHPGFAGGLGVDRIARVELFEQLRQEHEFGVGTIAGVAVKFGVHRRMVRQAIAGALPPPHRYPARSKPKLDAVVAFIDQVLDADRRQLAPDRLQSHFCLNSAE